jgi:F-type H+-transporting ATPase subunit a
MSEANIGVPEFPNVISVLAERFPDNPLVQNIHQWENVEFSWLVIFILFIIAYFSTRKFHMVPAGLQNAAEAVVEFLDDFVCGLMGPRGRRYTPFIGTLFVYILAMNLLGLVPFLKSSTTSWPTTLALALCVFCYVQYTAVKELGFFGYLDHLAGKPRGALAFTMIMPVFMFCLHILTEVIRPISLSLRLRSNIWGDDLLLAILAGFGLKGLPLLVLNMAMAVLVSIIQTAVFCLLTAVYFVLVMEDGEEHA